MSGIGMMDGAYFVGRNELLQWINSTLGLNLGKIEQTASGAVACQLMDALHPGTINISKVDFNAKNDYEYINNYKILQAAFTKLNLDKHIEVNKLIKARPLDNMEFMQWFKSYFESLAPNGLPDYDAAGRRAASKTGDLKAGSGPAGSNGIARSSSSKQSKFGAYAAPAVASGAAAASTSAPASSKPRAPVVRKASSGSLETRRSGDGSTEAAEAGTQTRQLTEQVTELKLKVDNAERERDFYFDKLRDIEILCQTPELQSIPIVKTFEKILYAADEQEAKEAMLEAQKQYAGSGAAATADQQ